MIHKIRGKYLAKKSAKKFLLNKYIYITIKLNCKKKYLTQTNCFFNYKGKITIYIKLSSST